MKHDPWNDEPGFWQAEATRVTDSLVAERMKNHTLTQELRGEIRARTIMTFLAVAGWSLFLIAGLMVPA
jgi:hypothetical protein